MPPSPYSSPEERLTLACLLTSGPLKQGFPKPLKDLGHGIAQEMAPNPKL